MCKSTSLIKSFSYPGFDLFILDFMVVGVIRDVLIGNVHKKTVFSFKIYLFVFIYLRESKYVSS